jgi:VWFA-related protein
MVFSLQHDAENQDPLPEGTTNVKVRLASTLLLTWASALGAAQPPATPVPSFGEAVDVNVVNVEVYATDASGRPVTGLRQRDFELREDGRRVSLSNFAAFEAGAAAAGEPEDRREAGAAASPEGSPEAAKPADAWNLIVYVDNFDLHAGNRSRALGQVRDFLAHQLAPGDRVMVVAYDMGLRILLPFSSDPAAVDAALRQAEKLAVHGQETDQSRRHAYQEILSIQESALASPQPKACPLNISRPAHGFAGARRDEVLRTLGGLSLLVNSLSGVPGRKAVLHVSDGIPATPGEEVFQFLAEICGGGSGTGGLGNQTHVGGNVIEDNSPDDGSGERRKPGAASDPNLDAMAVYDGRLLGPGAYQGASQGPIDAQTYNVAKQLDALVAHANAQRVTLYTLQASGVEVAGGSVSDLGPGDRLTRFTSIETAARTSLQNSLTALASGTGGRAILDVNQFGRDLQRMREDHESYYSLGYSPSHSGDGRDHRIEVKVKRAGVRVRYRESYRDKPASEKAVDRTLAALFYGLDDNPLGLSLEVGQQGPGPDGTVAVPITLRIPLFKVAVLNRDDTYEGSLRVLVAARTADGRMSPMRQIPVPIHIPRKEVLTALGQFYLYTLTLQLQPGEQRIAVGVRDDLASTAAYLSRSVTVGASSSTSATVPEVN